MVKSNKLDYKVDCTTCEEYARTMPVEIIHHKINRGLGESSRDLFERPFLPPEPSGTYEIRRDWQLARPPTLCISARPTTASRKMVCGLAALLTSASALLIPTPYHASSSRHRATAIVCDASLPPGWKEVRCALFFPCRCLECEALDDLLLAGDR